MSLPQPQPLDPQIARVLGRFPEVAAAWVFGSEARGQARPDSDLDIGLVFRQRGATALDHDRALRTMAAQLEAVVPGRAIDLVVLESQGPIFCHRVLSEGRRVYDADPQRRIDFESETYVRYFDFRPTYELANQHALAGFRDWFESRR
ncbi:MAG: nucleotidyltransferase domain-containing protein [Nannocystaceae bacterium]